MKISIVTLNITQSGGTEKAIKSFCDLLSEKYNIIIYSLSSSAHDRPFFDFLPNVNIKHLHLTTLPQPLCKKAKWFLKAFLSLQKQIKIDRPDRLMGYGHNLNFMLPYLRSGAMKVYGSEHIDINSIPGFSRKLMSVTYPRLDGLIVLSSVARSKAHHLNDQILIIPNCIEVNDQYNLSKREKSIIMVGRVEKEKGFDRLLPIARFLSQNFPEWCINVYGDGPMVPDIERQIDREGLNNVQMHGRVRNIDQKYKESSIFMMLSYSEAMPMVILEAKANGLPVIAYQNEGAACLIEDGVNGMLCTDEHEFLVKLADLIHDNYNVVEKIVKESKIQLKQYSGEKIKSKWIALLDAKTGKTK